MLQNNPLTAEHCKCLDAVLQKSGPALELAKACVDCGWPAEEFVAQLQAQLDQARKAKAKFFPMNP